MAKAKDMLENEYGIKQQVILTRNPQANSMVERAPNLTSTNLV
jgi:ribosomal protein S15P/S13E